jgi:hypothetical protein
VTLWLAGSPPGALQTLQQTDPWNQLEASGRIHSTARAAVEAFRTG